MRHPRECIYTHGMYYRGVSARLSIGAAKSDDEHFKFVCFFII
jgi:hypothetical protein